MPLNLASPGIVIREVDLTIGRVDPTSGSTGALVAPFEKGPVNDPQLIESEEDLLQTFGKPYSTDKHYEHWLVASSYLAYGGTLSVVRADDQLLRNAMVGTASDIKIKGREHYQQLGYDENEITGVTIAANSPGNWANGLKVAVIDAKTDQVLSGVTTTNIAVGMAVTVTASGTKYGKTASGLSTAVPIDGYFTGLVSEIVGISSIGVKFINHVAADGTVENKDYTESGTYAFPASGTIGVHTAGGANSSASSPFIQTAYTGVSDWFNTQQVEIKSNVGTSKEETVAYLDWSQLANKPGTSSYAAERGGRFDEVHVVVIDESGSVTGNIGTILEKHIALSKATDAEYSVGSSSYWRKYLEVNSRYIFAGEKPTNSSDVAVGFSTISNFSTSSLDSDWNQLASGITFATTGNTSYTLSKGTLYQGKADSIDANGNLVKAEENDYAFTPGLDDIMSGYKLFENAEETDVDFILMGSANYSLEEANQLGQTVIGVAESRQDCVAFVSPYRKAFLNDTSDGTAITVNDIDTITDNIIKFYSTMTSSTYGVLDSGYKYMFDRFNNTFRYVPLNGDIAGTCARTSLEQFPWFSPAGTARGAILNAVKLVYNPGKKQRDILYSNRINPVINSPGAGIILFGDKTAFGKASAFDRINVRRLFIYLEDAIAAAAKDQLFEFNDELTRTNFVNIIEPFLRDVQAKRGIFDFVVVCDETNNTAAVIDANEFVADIFIKPARSINFIGLTFVATRTGVSFEEVIGSV